MIRAARQLAAAADAALEAHSAPKPRKPVDGKHTPRWNAWRRNVADWSAARRESRSRLREALLNFESDLRARGIV